MNLSQTQLSQHLKRLEEKGEVDGSIGAKNIGRIIDLHNKKVDDNKDKKYDREIGARNKYFLPMVKFALKNGSFRKYKSNSWLMPKEREVN